MNEVIFLNSKDCVICQMFMSVDDISDLIANSFACDCIYAYDSEDDAWHFWGTKSDILSLINSLYD